MALSATQLFNSKLGRAFGLATIFTLAATNLATAVIAIDAGFSSRKTPTPMFHAVENCVSAKSLHHTPALWAGAALTMAPGHYAGQGIVEFAKIYGQTMNRMGPLPLMQYPH